MKELKIKQLTFSAAHYLPGHWKCGRIHGHTYIVRNLIIKYPEDKFVDFGDVKKIIDGWDHQFIIPRNHVPIWQEIAQTYGFQIATKAIKGSPIVENIANEIAREIREVTAAKEVRFELYEGLNQGVVVCVKVNLTSSGETR